MQMFGSSELKKLQKQVDKNPHDAAAQLELGRALLSQGRHGEAAPCFQRVLAMDAQNLAAYELLAVAQREGGLNDLAIKTLTNAHRTAQRLGEKARAQDFANTLRELGAVPPEIAEQQTERPAGADGVDGFACRRCGADGPVLDERPLKGVLGDVVVSATCESCWREWVAQGTMVINELRLVMHEPTAQETYEGQMRGFLQIE
jgi:Fe-S cluster biosynthesis and repair protein YggX